MPRVPTNPIARATTSPAATVFQSTRGATADAFGAGTGLTLQRVGAAFQREGENLSVLEQKIQHENARREAKRLDLAFAQKVRVLLEGDGTELNPGFLNMKGENALGPNLQNTQETVRSTYQELLRQTSDPEAQQLFTEAAGIRTERALTAIARHTAQQRREADNAIDEGRKAEAVSAATSNPETLAQSLEIIKDAQADQSDRNGDSEIVQRAHTNAAVSTAIRETIVAELKRNNLQSAKEIFKQFKGQMDGAVAAEVNRLLRTAQDLATSQEVADQAIAKFGTDELKGLAWIRQNHEGQIERAAVLDYSNRIAETKRANEQQVRDAMKEASLKVEQGTPLAQLANESPEQFALIQTDPILMARLESRAQAVAEGRKYASESDHQTFQRFSKLPAEQMAAVDLFSTRHQMTETEYNDALQLQKAARAAIDEATDTAPYNSAIKILDNMMPESWNSGRKDEIPEAKQLRARMRLWVQDFQTEHNRRPTVPEMSAEASRLLLPLVGDADKRILGIIPQDFETVVGLLRGPEGKPLSAQELQSARLPIENIPEQLYDEIVAALNKRNIPVTDELIEEIAASQVLNQRKRQQALFGIR